jgi:putative phosphoribosyl transferase
MDRFIDRRDAGLQLAKALHAYAHSPDTQILALPRGGVPVAYEVARILHLPLDILIVRKLGVPGHEELAMGAIAPGGQIFINDELVRQLSITPSTVHDVMDEEFKELTRRELVYRDNRPFPPVENKTIILIDDGIATGATMRVAIQALRHDHPAKLIVAIPVAAKSTCNELEPLVDELICLLRPMQFYAVGMWYDQFLQTTDEEVIELLGRPA